MVLSKRLGTILKEARETRKLAVRDVARETNMIPRYITALENEDYSQFPGETYALGFLRSYAEYLQLDTDHLLNLYRGLQIDQSQTPLRELTRPTTALPSIDRNVVVLFGGALLVLGVILLFALGVVSLPKFSLGGGASAAAGVCTKRSTAAITPVRRGTPPQIETLTKDNAVSFRLGDAAFRICLEQIKPAPEGKRIAVISLRLNESKDAEVQITEQEAARFGPGATAVKGLNQVVFITPLVLTDDTARVQIAYDEVATPTEGIIRVTLQFTEESYIQWIDDGRTHADTIPAGITRILEAKERLEIKVGNGGGVRIGRGGKLEVAGPPGKIVKFVYKRIPDPLDPARSRVEVTREVAR